MHNSAHPLPKSIGNPATNALQAAGITILEQVASRSRAELAALHGVGPKALRILEQYLNELSMDFKP